MKPKLLFLLLLSAVVVYFLYLSKGEEKVRVGAKAPFFTLPTRIESISLDRYRGKVVLLNFWATWCPACRQEIPSLEALNLQMQGKDFQLLAVSLDEEGWPAVDRFLSVYPLTIMILLDVRGDVASLYGTYQLPESYLIDKNGTIVKKYVGPEEWTDPQILKEILKYVEKGS